MSNIKVFSYHEGFYNEQEHFLQGFRSCETKLAYLYGIVFQRRLIDSLEPLKSINIWRIIREEGIMQVWLLDGFFHFVKELGYE